MSYNFESNLKKICKEKDITKRTLSLETGATMATVYGWFKGAKIGDTYLQRLCEFLEVEPKELLYGGEDENTVPENFDREVMTKIMEAIEERCDNNGIKLSVRQKIYIAHMAYGQIMETEEWPDENFLTNVISIASAR